MSGLIASGFFAPTVYWNWVVSGEELARRRFRGGVSIFPEGQEDLLGRFAHAFEVGVGVLDHEAGDLRRTLRKNPEAHRAAVVLHVEDVRGEAEVIDETSDAARQVLESVVEFGRGRRVGLAEPDVIRGDHVEAVGQGWDQVAEHVRAGWETVQQHDRGGGWVAGFAIEYAAAIDGRATVMDPAGCLGRDVGHPSVSFSVRNSLRDRKWEPSWRR